jgi:hypothetical protein
MLAKPRLPTSGTKGGRQLAINKTGRSKGKVNNITVAGPDISEYTEQIL